MLNRQELAKFGLGFQGVEFAVAVPKINKKLGIAYIADLICKFWRGISPIFKSKFLRVGKVED